MLRSFTLLTTALGAATTLAQCPSTIGAYDGTPEAGNPHTPFATNTGSNNARGQRVQYIYPASELIGAGLCAGPITDIAFKALQTDVSDPGPDGVLNTGDDGPIRCDLLADLRLGHTSLDNFGPPVSSSSLPLSVDWETNAESSANLHVNSYLARTVEIGWVEFPLTSGGFVWDGVNNLVIEVAWLRNTVVGLSPAVELQEGLSYTATKWVQATLPNLNHGNTFQDNPLSVNTVTGTTTTRPVTRFNNGSLATLAVPLPTTASVYADVAGSALVIARSDAAHDWTVELVDAAGRLIATERMTVGTSVLRMPLPVGYSGVVMAAAADARGVHTSLGRAVFTQ